MKKIIMFTGGNETQEYFTLQLAKAFEKLGHEIFLYRLNKVEADIPALDKFIEEKNTVMITFNFQGLDNDFPFYMNNLYLWEVLDIPCYNIVLDHPFYYHKFLATVPPRYIHISIDHGHERYMKRFFPHIKLGPFLPLAGTQISDRPFEDRITDIVFTGNYTPPQKFEMYITRLNDDYTAFYRGIIEDLISNPSMGIDTAFEKHLIREMPDLSDDDMKECMTKMIFLDLYVRFYFRGLAVKELTENGFPVHLFGGGWEKFECRKPDNVILGRTVASEGCLEVISESKISLNVMPWFKEGGHDRIFNSMLNGAVSLSDDSIWLRENLEDGRDIVFYSLTDMDQLPSIADELLSNPAKMKELAYNGYQKAKTFHTWANRAEVLEKLINSEGI